MNSKWIITVFKEGQLLLEKEMSESFSLGRGKNAQICIEDRAISREHIVFKPEDDGVEFYNKSQFSPIVYNGSEIQNGILKDQEKIVLGSYVIQVFIKNKQEIDEKNKEKEEEKKEEIEEKIEEDPNKKSDFNEEFLNIVNDSNSEEKFLEEISLEKNQESTQIGVDASTHLLKKDILQSRLIFKKGDANYLVYEINKESVSIGRSEDCDIVLNDKKSSRKHALILRSDSKFTIQDLNSHNGTIVNEEKIKERDLSSGDKIQIANTIIEFSVNHSNYSEIKKDFLSVSDIDKEEAFASLSLDDSNKNYQKEKDASFNEEIIGIKNHARKTLLEKFKALPKRTQYIGIVATILVLMWLNEDDPVPVVKKHQNIKKNPITAVKSEKSNESLSFDSLSDEKKKFVETQHQIAFDFYKNREYDKSIFEIQKIFLLVSDYKDSRELEHYAKEGKHKMEAMEEEKRKKEAEEKLKTKINDLVENTKIKMQKKEYAQAKENFSEIIALDPDNTSVQEWKKTIENEEEEKKNKEKQLAVQRQINDHGFQMYHESKAIEKKGSYHLAIENFVKILDSGISDKKLIESVKQNIKICHYQLEKTRKPLLRKAKILEKNGRFAEALSVYRKLVFMDPSYRDAYGNIKKINHILHDQAKTIYTEALIAESYSDFSISKKMFEDCLRIAPVNDIYHSRAQRKLARYFKTE
jgi:pSer/pThr/pTyr-binding forkhead associated (FHA) protein